MNLNTSRSGRKGGISKRKRCATQPVTAVIDPFSGEVTPSTQPTKQPIVASTNPIQQSFPTAPQRSSCQIPVYSSNQHNQEVDWQLPRQQRQDNRLRQDNVLHRNVVPQNNQQQHVIWQPYLNMNESRTSTLETGTVSANIQQNLLNPVPPGIPLPPKPPVPESNNPYFLAQIRGNISKCSGCAATFKKPYPLPPPDNNFVIGRKEKDWFPYTQPNGEKYWKLGREQNRYYHLNYVA